MRILAIDFGLKRTGLAVTDPLQIIAHALDTVETKVLMVYLIKYFASEKVEEIIIGHPKHADDTDADIMVNIRLFADELSKNFNDKKITFWDERYTSKRASQAMVMAGIKKKDRQKKENIDKIAATILLQDYLEFKK
jgi:putative Holliday junction resolvase